MVKVRGARQDREGRGLAFDEKGARRNLILEEHRAFWTWAAVEFFRIEEMMEVSHHSVTQYAVPRSGEVIPLLQIAPSKISCRVTIQDSPSRKGKLSINTA
jgi:hypothetical protein